MDYDMTYADADYDQGGGGICEDAPCCGCCPRDEGDTGMTKGDYMELMMRDDYDDDIGFDFD